MNKDTAVYNGTFLLKDDEPLFGLIKNLDSTYLAKEYEKAFDTNIYIGVEYRFDVDKLRELFKKYEEKYSTEEKFEHGNNTYRLYDLRQNGGVYDINYDDIKEDKSINKFLNSDGTLSLNITVEGKGGKSYIGEFSEEGTFVIQFFKYNEHYGNTVIYAMFTTKEKLKEFFTDLQSCIVSIDEEQLRNSLKEYEDEINLSIQTKDKINAILNDNKNKKK